MLEMLQSNDFDVYLNQDFEMTAPGGEQLKATLTEVKKSAMITKDRRAPFSAIFLIHTDAVHPQGTFHVSRDSFEPMDIFLVPISQNDHGVEYEAIFT